MKKIILFLTLYVPLIAFSSIVHECRYDQFSVPQVDVVNLALPEGEVAESLKVEVLSSCVLPKTYEIKTSPDYLDYKKESPSPEVRAELISTNILAGNSIARIAVYPLASLPGEDKVVFYDNIRLTLYTKFSGNNGISKGIRTQYSDYMEEEALKSIVDNDYDISLSPEVSGKDRSTVVEYIIITNDALASGIEVFANYLKRKGVVAEIATVEDIVSCEDYYDNISGLYDTPGKIRGYLMEKYAEGAQWVLLAGDEDVVPVRYGTYARNITYIDYRAPSDLYYSDLNGNWNIDGDSLLGEPYDDSVDVFPELYVGRVPCSNIEEFNNWFEKLVSYETNPGGGNTAYLTKFFWSGADMVREGPEYTIENAQLPGYISNDTTMLEVEPEGVLPKGSDVIDKMNELFGLFNCFGHGSPSNMTVSAPGDNLPSPYRNFIVSVDSVEEYEGNHYTEYGNGLDSLKNKDYYGILSICSCFQAAFDWEKFPERFLNVRGPSMGEAFLFLPERGGPAFRGYTRYGGSYRQLGRLEFSFLNKLFVDGITNIGAAEALSKNEYPFYYVQSNHTLLGCPLMRVWTAIPSEFTNVSITESDTSIIVNTGVSGCDICVCSSIDNGDSYYKVIHNTLSYTFITSVRPLYLTITKPNYIPYMTLLPIDLYLNNITVEIGDTIDYIASNSITAAGNGAYFIIEGNGSTGGNVTMQAGNYISLLPGFHAQTGCSFDTYIANPVQSDESITEPLTLAADEEKVENSNSLEKAKETTKETKEPIPTVFSCSQNSPNPFNVNTTIRYGLPKNSNVSLCIYNLAGQKIQTLVDANESAGYKSVSWDGRNSSSTEVPQGIYFYVFKAGAFTMHSKMIVVR